MFSQKITISYLLSKYYLLFLFVNKKNDMPRTESQNIEKRKKTRSKILSTALKLFAEKGYTATTIDDIAREAKISKGLAYNYFKNKKELLKSVIGMIQPILDEMFSSINNTLPPSEQLRDFIKLSMDSIEKEKDFWRFYFMLSVQPDIIEHVSNFFADFITEGLSIIERLFRKCKIKNAKAEAKILGALIDGIALHYMLTHANYPLKSVKKKLLERYSEENFCKRKSSPNN